MAKRPQSYRDDRGFDLEFGPQGAQVAMNLGGAILSGSAVVVALIFTAFGMDGLSGLALGIVVLLIVIVTIIVLAIGVKLVMWVVAWQDEREERRKTLDAQLRLAETEIQRRGAEVRSIEAKSQKLLPQPPEETGESQWQYIEMDESLSKVRRR